MLNNWSDNWWYLETRHFFTQSIQGTFCSRGINFISLIGNVNFPSNIKYTSIDRKLFKMFGWCGCATSLAAWHGLTSNYQRTALELFNFKTCIAKILNRLLKCIQMNLDVKTEEFFFLHWQFLMCWTHYACVRTFTKSKYWEDFGHCLHF